MSRTTPQSLSAHYYAAMNYRWRVLYQGWAWHTEASTLGSVLAASCHTARPPSIGTYYPTPWGQIRAGTLTQHTHWAQSDRRGPQQPLLL